MLFGVVTGRSGDRISVGSEFSAPVQAGRGATQPHGRVVALTTHPLPVPRLNKV
jgi:hypothetical protein